MNEMLLTFGLEASLPLLNKGKVREIFSINETTLLFITTDRISAFDIVLNSSIPSKGAILTLFAHWAHVLTTALPYLRTHILALTLPPQIPPTLHPTYLGRSMQVRSLMPFKIEAIIRGRLRREIWDSYLINNTVYGSPLPPGFCEGETFPDGPIYTPSTKADAC